MIITTHFHLWIDYDAKYCLQCECCVMEVLEIVFLENVVAR